MRLVMPDRGQGWQPFSRCLTTARRVVVLVGGLVLLVPLLAGCGAPSFLITPVSSSPKLEEVEVQPGEGLSSDRVAVVEIEGMLVNARVGGLLQGTENPLSRFSQQLDKAAKDRRVKAVVLRINSPGGTVTCSETMYRLVRRFKEKTGKVVIAAAQEVSASGGYMVALSADRIVATPTSVVGSIGVIFQTFHVEQTLGFIGVKVETIKSGELKDMGSPFRSMNERDRKVIEDMVEGFYARFVGLLRERRGLTDEATLKTATDGRVFTGEQALALGLVDQLGSLEETIDLARQLAGAPKARAVMYIRPYGYTGSIYASQPLSPARSERGAVFELPESLQPLPAGFYYLWRP